MITPLFAAFGGVQSTVTTTTSGTSTATEARLDFPTQPAVDTTTTATSWANFAAAIRSASTGTAWHKIILGTGAVATVTGTSDTFGATICAEKRLVLEFASGTVLSFGDATAQTVIFNADPTDLIQISQIDATATTHTILHSNSATGFPSWVATDNWIKFVSLGSPGYPGRDQTRRMGEFLFCTGLTATTVQFREGLFKGPTGGIGTDYPSNATDCFLMRMLIQDDSLYWINLNTTNSASDLDINWWVFRNLNRAMFDTPHVIANADDFNAFDGIFNLNSCVDCKTYNPEMRSGNDNTNNDVYGWRAQHGSTRITVIHATDHVFENKWSRHGIDSQAGPGQSGTGIAEAITAGIPRDIYVYRGVYRETGAGVLTMHMGLEWTFDSIRATHSVPSKVSYFFRDRGHRVANATIDNSIQFYDEAQDWQDASPAVVANGQQDFYKCVFRHPSGNWLFDYPTGIEAPSNNAIIYKGFTATDCLWDVAATVSYSNLARLRSDAGAGAQMDGDWTFSQTTSSTATLGMVATTNKPSSEFFECLDNVRLTFNNFEIWTWGTATIPILDLGSTGCQATGTIIVNEPATATGFVRESIGAGIDGVTYIYRQYS